MRRIEVTDSEGHDWGTFGGIQMHLEGNSGSIYIAFNREELDREQETPLVCELFLGMDWKPGPIWPYNSLGMRYAADMNKWDGEIVSFQNALQDMSDEEILLVRGDTWYRVQISEDDKIACETGWDPGADEEIELKICDPKCPRFEDHHYYVRLREEWKLPKSPALQRAYRF